MVKYDWNIGLGMGKGKVRFWNSKQGPEHGFVSYTKLFGFGPRVNEEMLQILRGKRLTRFGILGSSLY